ncbi:MAG: zinc ribbon domain-containing protein [Deltaproteobacteria bacterium]|nr:zinc ribbon domain-containing protein [Deltaproteobacteria bacterium]
MPLFDYLCLDCGKTTEVMVRGSSDDVKCGYCKSANLKKLLAAHSSASGSSPNRLPGAGDTACCGSVPGQASGCAGPGSCCGNNF